MTAPALIRKADVRRIGNGRSGGPTPLAEFRASRLANLPESTTQACGVPKTLANLSGDQNA